MEMSKYEISTMEEFVTNDGVTIKYIDTASKDSEEKAVKEILILASVIDYSDARLL